MEMLDTPEGTVQVVAVVYILVTCAGAIIEIKRNEKKEELLSKKKFIFCWRWFIKRKNML